MKKRYTLISLFCALFLFNTYACSDTSSSNNKGAETKPSTSSSQNKDSATKPSTPPSTTTSNSNLGNYNVIIDSCRIAKDYEGNDVVIVKYKFTNNDDEPASFMWSLDDSVFQNGIELNRSYFLDNSANYSSENMSKEIKTGVSLYIEVAYELNDSTTDIEVEVSELISLNDKTITKTFSIN